MIAPTIFKDSLRKCYSPSGIRAGLHHFSDLWSRDSMWASIGALELGDYDVVAANLRTFFNAEKNGLLPLRMGNRSLIQSFVGLRSKNLYPHYFDDKRSGFCSYSLTLPIIVLCFYTTKTNDSLLLNNMISVVKRIFKTLDARLVDGLLSEGFYSTWMDSTKKKGNIFYSNLLYCLSLRLFSQLSADKKYLAKAQLVEKRIIDVFWNGDYFVDWKGNNDKDYFDTFANLLAIFFNFGTKTQHARILSFIEKNELVNENGLIKKSFPAYNARYVSGFTKFIGLSDYVLNIYYPWMTLMYFICLRKVNRVRSCFEEKFINLVQSQGTVYESYDLNGRPFKKLFYRSEEPFAWAASFGVVYFT